MLYPQIPTKCAFWGWENPRRNTQIFHSDTDADKWPKGQHNKIHVLAQFHGPEANEPDFCSLLHSTIRDIAVQREPAMFCMSSMGRARLN